MRSVARIYAEALAEAAIEGKKVQQVKRELAGFLALLEESAELQKFLTSPAVPQENKRAVTEKLVHRIGAGRELRNFLFVVEDHRRSRLLPEIGRQFDGVLNTHLGIAEAQVTSARELTEAEKAEMIRVLERLTGKRVEAHYALMPELIGGAIVKIGSTVYDGSVRAQLSRLCARLAAGKADTGSREYGNDQG